jgi:hypothetical protein
MGHKAGHYTMSIGEKEKNTSTNFSQKDNETISKSTVGKMASAMDLIANQVPQSISKSTAGKMAKQSVSQIKKAAGLGGVSVLQKPDEFFAKKKDKK